jgi:hypothetical protein
VYALQTLARGTSKGRLICNAGPIEIEYADGVAKAGIPHNYHHHDENEYSVEDVWKIYPVLKKESIKPKAVDLVSPVKGVSRYLS